MAEQRIILTSINAAPGAPDVQHPIAAEATVLPTSPATASASASGADAAIDGGKVRWRSFLF